MPLSSFTKKALKEAKFNHMTLIQRYSIPHALAGRDILGSARTGSGKTLAFLIPMLENLYRNQWTNDSGCGAIIISPTRELAMQIFDVLRIVGKYHKFSAGLVIGGHNFEDEQQQIIYCNILIATPGRLLHHMDHTYGFEAPYLKILILDEADRLLELGFEHTLHAILDNLPIESRQTLLFSATQTKSIKKLAKLSLKNPEYAAVHAHKNIESTPDKLKQYYMILDHHYKFDMIWSFCKTHLQQKSIIFLSTCKQVRYIYQMFKLSRPGIPIIHLHGKMRQDKRLEMYQRFITANRIVLFATDIAARGLDFPNVDWVIQADCPDHIDTYIHRVGRTARYRNHGNAILLIDKNQVNIIKYIKNKNIPIKQVKSNIKNFQYISNKFSSYLAADPSLKYLAQKAFISYIRSIYLQKDKSIFNIESININKLALTMGLAGIPKINILRTSQNKKNMPYKLQSLYQPQENTKNKTQVEKLIHRQNTTVYSQHYMNLIANDDDDDTSNASDHSSSDIDHFMIKKN